MPRDSELYVKDMLEAIEKIGHYAKDMDFRQFSKSEIVVDATLRNLEILGEAAKNIPSEVKSANPEIEWKKISGLRDVLIHAYSGINTEIVWDIVKNKLPALKAGLENLKK